MTFAEDYKTALLGTVNNIDTEKVSQAIEWFRSALDNDHHIFVCGNGGSGSTASHFVCDILKGASYQRDKRFRIISLCDSVATLTAYSNDVCYDSAFVEQLKNYAKPGDLVMALSGSGNSPSVLKAIEYANSAGCKTIALTGRDGGKLGPLAQLNIQVAEQHMGRIEDAHLIICHMIAYHLMETAAC
jgi:D-sedoheptulose 7-phosphate isomerase